MFLLQIFVFCLLVWYGTLVLARAVRSSKIAEGGPSAWPSSAWRRCSAGAGRARAAVRAQARAQVARVHDEAQRPALPRIPRATLHSPLRKAPSDVSKS